MKTVSIYIYLCAALGLMTMACGPANEANQHLQNLEQNTQNLNTISQSLTQVTSELHQLQVTTQQLASTFMAFAPTNGVGSRIEVPDLPPTETGSLPPPTQTPTHTTPSLSRELSEYRRNLELLTQNLNQLSRSLQTLESRVRELPQTTPTSGGQVQP